ncbi:hypothetical protein SMSP2_01338 [Limihaloglobus sulfuriphilus]|uniref:LamG-like jellyroll fold domain-containing protein n=1 Tax=Limihaloglobus sulfuriphilus TaxID=1851148 RepID=A0A1Q2MEA4_9BACT|nr:LamG-like jellyroll fold domain-containing protein [Limihaloglobus sulfuriphilus]AQQ70974.1 hypothetical protein SMSP2_01338 [Limihaloglobus sulfuriphilus]
MNKKFLLVIVMTSLGFALTTDATTLAYWKFEEGQGQTIANEIAGGNSLVRGIDINDTNDPAWADGIVDDYALNYADGQWCSFAEADGAETLSSQMLASSFTVEAYFNMDSLPENGYAEGYHVVGLFNRQANSDGYCGGWANYAIRLRTADDGATYAEGYFTNVGGSYPTVTSVVPLRAGKDYYVAFSFDSSTGTVAIQVDSRVTSSTWTMGPYNVFEHPYFTVGAKSPGSIPSGFMRGTVDEVRISDTALTSEELLYQGSAYTDTNVIAFWQFEEGVGQYPIDETGKTSSNFIRGTSATGWMDPEWVAGINGNHALRFMKLAAPANGTTLSFINGYTTEQDSAALIASSFTIEAFFNMSAVPAAGYSDVRYIVSLCGRDGTYANYWNYSVRIRTVEGVGDEPDQTFVEGVSRSADGNWPTVTSSVPLEIGTDYYVAYSYDEITNEAAIWVDGNKETVIFSQTPISTQLTNPMFTIGSRAPSVSYSGFFEGVIDDVRISNIVQPDNNLLIRNCGGWGYSPMDFNKDCVVDAADLSTFASSWLNCTDPTDPLFNAE